MNEFDDSLLDRDLNEVLGGDAPDPQLKARIVHALKGQSPFSVQPKAEQKMGTVPLGRPRPLPAKRTPWGAYAAAAAALAIAITAFGWALTRPKEITSTNESAPVSEKQPEQPKPAPNAAPESKPQSQPQPQPEPQNDGDTPEPEKPVPQPQPEREPEPQPQPEPEKPDVVEKPEPQPEPAPETPDTQAPAEERRVVASVSAEAKLKYRALAGGEWQKFEGTEILEGWQLKADAPADLLLANGTLLRFEGELALKTAEAELLGRRTELYVDSLGVEGALLLVRDEARIEMSGSEAYFDASGSAVEIFCFEGKAGEVAAGRYAKLSSRGLSGLRELKETERSPRLLKGLPPRRLFISESDESCKGENSSITLKVERELVNIPGAELRLRFRPKNAGALYMQVQQQAGKLQWGKWLPLAKSGEWLEWSIPLADLQRDDGAEPGAFMQPGDTFATINIFIQDGKQAELEIDWLEIVRVRKE